MKKNKKQNGAISLFVLLSMMFFLVFMIGAFSLVTRRNASQVEALKETQSIYSSGQSASDVYDSIMATSNSVVPISNKQQLEKVIEISNSSTNVKANYVINGNVYTYKKDANYILQNDIVLDLKEEINGKSDITIYDYILYSNKANIDTNGYDIFYAQTDGSLWKCVFYQDIGTSDSPNLFTTNAENSNYYGRSYSPTLYSILEDGVTNYQKAWVDNAGNTTYYELMLMYNLYDGKFDNSKYNRWRQTNDPSKDDSDENKVSPVPGYTIDFDGGTTAGLGTTWVPNSTDGYVTFWGGLTKSTSSTWTYLDGAVGPHGVQQNDSFYYAVGCSRFYAPNGMPVSFAYDGYSTGKSDTASECLLFVRTK